MALRDFFRLIRPLNCIMASVGVLVGFIASSQGLAFGLPVLLAMVSAFLVCGAGQAVNDYFDLEVDKKKRLRKPLAIGDVKKEPVLLFSSSLFGAGIILAFFVNMQAFLLAVVFSALLFVYSWKLAQAKFIGNLVVAAGTAATIIFGATITGNYYFAAFFAASAFFANVGREITKDVEDAVSDRGIKKSLPQYFEAKDVALVVLFAYALAIASALSLWFDNSIQSLAYFFLVAGSSALFFASWMKLYSGNPQKSQQLSKAAMIVSLLAFALWVFV